MTGKKCRILLVDDHVDTLDVLCKLLRLEGYEVIGAECLASAVNCAAAQQFDLLITDLKLPDGEGTQLIEQIARPQRIPAIALTGMGMTAEIQGGLSAGFQEYLLKPISLEVLVKTVGNVLKAHAAANGKPPFGEIPASPFQA